MLIKQLSPSPLLLKLCAMWGVLALLLACVQIWFPAVEDGVQLLAVGVLVTVVVAIWDVWQTRRVLPIKIVRQVPHTVPVNGWSRVELVVQHQLARAMQVTVFDWHPVDFQIKHLSQQIWLKPGHSSALSYEICPTQRGTAEFHQAELLLSSPFGLWRKSQLYPCVSTVRVYPDFKAITRYQILATDNRTSQLGIKRKQRRGEGMEFHQLRDYRIGDTARQIDWKATVRRGKLISREYQDERDQQLVFMLDCGRSMRTQDGLLSHFDHALNALLLLGYVALKQGDAVGLMSFSGAQRWLPPVKSQTGVNTLLNAVYDLQPSTEASDYHRAAETLLKYQRKRALIIFMTKVYDETMDELLPMLKLLRRSHLVLVANLREEVVDAAIQSPIKELEDALNYLGANLYQRERQNIQNQFRQHGILSLDVTAKQLPAAVVNSYWEIKRRGGL